VLLGESGPRPEPLAPDELEPPGLYVLPDVELPVLPDVPDPLDVPYEPDESEPEDELGDTLPELEPPGVPYPELPLPGVVPIFPDVEPVPDVP